MKKFTKIVAGMTAVVLSFGIFAGCTKQTTYPTFINNEATSDAKREKYNVYVQSEGGAKLNNVKVSVKNAEGAVLRRSISSNGLIELNLPLGEYTLEVDETSLPAGYSIKQKTYKTNATERENVYIVATSHLIGAGESGCTYSVGGIMKDFTFTDYNGKKHVLSEEFNEQGKKAVVLNFFYTACNPCKVEFPAIQSAYAKSTGVEIFAICSTHQGDTNANVAEFAGDLGLTFPMGVDDQGMTSAFSVASFPTTVVIDRYGMIAYRSVGNETKESFWTNLFNKYTADSYVQDTNGSNDDKDGDSDSQTMVKPNVTMPSSNEMDVAASMKDSPLQAVYRPDENEYSWPWVTGSDADGNSYIHSSNTGVDNSYSIVYVSDINMKKGQVLSFEYMVDSEPGRDTLAVMVDGTIISGEGWSGVTTWTPVTAYVADRDTKIELAFSFLKDGGDPDEFKGDDMAKIRNLNIADRIANDAKPTDILRTCASGGVTVSGGISKYERYETVVLGDDNLYHKGDKNGPLVYITLNQLTPWNNLHAGATTKYDEGTYYNTLYMMTYHRYGETKNDKFSVVLGGKDLTNTVVTYWAIADYMEYPYYLMPVTPQLKVWVDEFLKRYEADAGLKVHDDEWLEFCYYYDHYGAAHEKCPTVTDLTRGMTKYNSYTAYEKNDPDISNSEMYNSKTERLSVQVNFPLVYNNGIYFKFVPTETGVYNIRSYTTGCSSPQVSPTLAIMDSEGNFTENVPFIRDFDSKMTVGEGGVIYEGFNHYVTLKAGEMIYVFPGVYTGSTGYYDFEITYKGPTYKKLFVASTFSGVWESATRYAAVDVAYDSASDCYYKTNADRSINYSQPIYISMVHESYLYSDFIYQDPLTGKAEDSTFKSLEWLIEKGAFDDVWLAPTAKMTRYLNNAKANTDNIRDENGNPIYGLVKANKDIVEILNSYADTYIDGEGVGRGEGNSWLAFACYMEYFG